MSPSGKVYENEHLNHLAFPLGGMGAGMICLEGSGALSHVSLRHRPDIFHEPLIYSAVCIKGSADKPNVARVLEGPVPARKIFGGPKAGEGLGGSSYGFPRFSKASFRNRMPFGEISLSDSELPLSIKLTGWSPFIPTDADASSLPVAGLEYEITNTGSKKLECVFSSHWSNMISVSHHEAAKREIRRIPNGFVLRQPGREPAIHEEGAFALIVDDPDVRVDAAWFRGDWFDAKSMNWKNVEDGNIIDKTPHETGDCGAGASIYIPILLKPNQSKRIVIKMAWYVPFSKERYGSEVPVDPSSHDHKNNSLPHHEPWYASRFASIDRVMDYWKANYEVLRQRSSLFSESLFDSSLPEDIIDSVASNLTILKSPTVLREKQGRLWAWEGCGDTHGSCFGSCTHVWNYAQALAHLFPDMERSLRQTEFVENLSPQGQQNFRASLPIRPIASFGRHAAADGQLGGIMKIHRDWKISGDTVWLRSMWPAIEKSLEYCIRTWDPNCEGILREPHHNTYDIEFWGPNGMCTSFYLGALRAGVLMGRFLGKDVQVWDDLYQRGRKYTEEKLFNGEYFYQETQWKGLNADISDFQPGVWKSQWSPEEKELVKKEGPKYQYGTGCLSDGVIGAWMAKVCGVGEILDESKVKSHLLAVHRHNLKHNLGNHANVQRSTYAQGQDGGLLLCSWPRGNRPSLPFVYSDEVWTGIEYQVASHLISIGCVDEGLEIVRVLRRRYDGRIRNPFDEYECGHWYARALASYSLLSAISGGKYDAVSKTLTLAPRIQGDFKCFFSTATGFGQIGVKEGKPFLDVRYGTIDVKELNYLPR